MGKLEGYVSDGYSFEIPGKHNGKDYVCKVTLIENSLPQVELEDMSNFSLAEADEILDYVESLKDSYPTRQ